VVAAKGSKKVVEGPPFQVETRTFLAARSNRFDSLINRMVSDVSAVAFWRDCH